MKISRYWSSTYEVADEWNYQAELTPSRLALNYPKLKLQTNSLGFRYTENDILTEQEVIIVLGGSTTFGHYCSIEEAWPNKLQAKTKTKILNLGQPKSDLWASFVTLLDFIRAHPKLKVTMVITYDGINQNIAYGHFMRDSKEYSPEHINYRVLKRNFDLFNEMSEKKFNLKNFGFFLFGEKFKKYLINKEKDKRLDPQQKNLSLMDSLVINESRYFISTLNLLKNFCLKSLEARFFHFLEPTLFDVLPVMDNGQDEDHIYRRKYYQKLYKKISVVYPEKWNLSSKINLTPHDFIDFAHLTPNGHSIIADHIWKEISTSVPTRF